MSFRALAARLGRLLTRLAQVCVQKQQKTPDFSTIFQLICGQLPAYPQDDMCRSDLILPNLVFCPRSVLFGYKRFPAHLK
jgi:hypothetical protein